MTEHSQPEIVIRAAIPDDAETVHTLVGEIAAHQAQSASVTVTAEQWAGYLERPEITVLLAEGDGDPVGYVSAVRRLHLWSGSDIIALDDLYVRPGHRDAGVGKLLMTELANRSGDLTITWGVQPDNDAAIRFYRRLGATVRAKVMCAWPAQRR
ncbi:GNAT family N-acetyltransferase [Nocardioides albus]|uniref:Ribosomal protein S18 acetylase RimI-like enzyme n=1 Tax=Nocardioides albus TaxID=1841 RepID=A0A7W5F8H0_9ACTN|nr:GNAT family N-acetyltransferase [Nocardioides albus]MBB3089051.1 ribosomal protein S18 acetylase RimI-like enzyme [Nocardioides albus]GGU14569.1 N-acetyltransferase [Nocardioides albus]